jgi:hypothetical protein
MARAGSAGDAYVESAPELLLGVFSIVECELELNHAIMSSYTYLFRPEGGCDDLDDVELELIVVYCSVV